MNLAHPFVRRPVASSMIAVALVLVGALAYGLLPVAPLPQVDFPSIRVSASLPGASPETMATSVAAPLERALGAIAGVTGIWSDSRQGSCSIFLEFAQGRKLDAAARDVQAAINAARGQLPAGMPGNPTIRKSNPSQAPIMALALSSPNLAPGTTASRSTRCAGPSARPTPCGRAAPSSRARASGRCRSAASSAAPPNTCR
jgi:multidrug efflux pump